MTVRPWTSTADLVSPLRFSPSLSGRQRTATLTDDCRKPPLVCRWSAAGPPPWSGLPLRERAGVVRAALVKESGGLTAVAPRLSASQRRCSAGGPRRAGCSAAPRRRARAATARRRSWSRRMVRTRRGVAARRVARRLLGGRWSDGPAAFYCGAAGAGGERPIESERAESSSIVPITAPPKFAELANGTCACFARIMASSCARCFESKGCRPLFHPVTDANN